MSGVCTLTVDQLMRFYPELKPHENCPVCEKRGQSILIGEHQNPVAAPLLQGTALCSSIYNAMRSFSIPLTLLSFFLSFFLLPLDYILIYLLFFLFTEPDK